MTFEAYDVVVVPFPFTDRTATKRRPALVISDGIAFNAKVGHSELAMITSAKNSDWPEDTVISDLDAAGLSSDSVIRMKLFTLDNQLILRRAGSLASKDRAGVRDSLSRVLGLSG